MTNENENENNETYLSLCSLRALWWKLTVYFRTCIPDNHNDDAEGEKLRNEIK